MFEAYKNFTPSESLIGTDTLSGQLFLPFNDRRASIVLEDEKEKLLLPPEEKRLFRKGFKIETAVFENGIVDIDTTIEIVKTAVPEDYVWRGFSDVHHIHGPSNLFVSPNLFNHDKMRLYKRFVDLAVNKVILPREFHNLLHLVTLPAGPPKEDVMHFRINGWETAKRLWKRFDEANKVFKLTELRRLDVERHPERIMGREYDEEAVRWFQLMMRRHFRGSSYDLKCLEKIPKSFQLLDPEVVGEIMDSNSIEGVDIGKVQKLHGRVKWIGSIAAEGGHVIRSTSIKKAA